MKGKKIILPLLLTSVVASPLVANLSSASILSNSAPVYAENLDTTMTGTLLQVKNNFEGPIARGEDVAYANMPSVVGASISYDLIIKNPNGKQVAKYSATDLASESAYTTKGAFKPELNGNYTFSFRATGTNTITTLCDDIVVTVTDDTYTMTKSSNNYWSLPTTVATGKTLGFAVPEVAKVGSSEELPLEFSVSDYTGTQDLSSANGVLVKVTGANQTTYLTDFVEEANGVPAHYSFTPATAGRYSVTYYYYKEGKVVSVISGDSFRAVQGYNAEQEYDLTFSFNSSVGSVSKVLGNEVKLPTVKAVNKNNTSETVNAYTKIIVTYTGGSSHAEEQAIVGTDAAKTVVEDYKYTYKWAGNYKVEYQVLIPNLGVSSVVSTKYITGVTDTVKPTISIVDAYTVDYATKTITNSASTPKVETELNGKEEIVEFLGDKTHTLNSVYQLNGDGYVSVTIPAAVATDNYDNVSDFFKDAEDIQIKREVYRSGNVSDKLVKIDNNKANENLTLEFGTGNITGTDNPRYAVGKYVVKYYAYDRAHPESATIASYTIEIKEKDSLFTAEEAESAVPTVYMQYFDNTRVEKTDTITFSKPTATDYNSQDSNLDIQTYYVIGEAGLEITALQSNAKVLGVDNVDENGKYFIDLSKETIGADDTTVYIFAIARNDYNNANYGYELRTLTIRGTVTDNGPANFAVSQIKVMEGEPGEEEENTYNTFAAGLAYVNGLAPTAINEYGLLSDGKEPFNQLDEIMLPSVEFTDDNQELTISVDVYYNGETADKTTSAELLKQFNVSLSGSAGSYVHKVSGGSFVASYAGMYTITYKAVDEAGNITAQSFGVMIKDTVAPSIIVVDREKFSADHEVGKSFTVPAAQTRDNGVVSNTNPVTWEVESNGKKLELNKPYGFTPKDIGEYYIIYTATDGSGNEAISQRYVLHVTAGENLPAPVLASQDFEREVEWTDTDETNGSKTITIPNATITMPNLGETVAVSITVKNSSNKTKAVVDGESDLFKTFEADGQGVYTVTYSGRDRFGRTSTTDLSIYVGDWKAPEFSWKNSENKPSSEVTLNSTWDFDITMMDVTDDGEYTHTISMKAPNGKDATKNSKGEYVFDQVGTYTFRVTFEDEAGNTDHETISINVVAEDEEETTKTSNAVTTVMIVLSVVVLGGVVAYFVLSSRKKGTKSKKSK